MKRVAGFAALGMLVALAWATGGGVVFRDKEGNIEIRDLTSWRVSRVSEKTLAFRGAGAPFVGNFKSQGIAVKGRNIEGRMTNRGKGYELETANVKGGVSAEISERGSQRKSDLRGDTLNLVGGADETTATLSGGVNVRSTDPAKSQTFSISGSTAVAKLEPFGAKSDWPMKRLEMSGPVTMRLQTAQRTESGKSNAVDITGRAERLIYDDAARTITLIGNVRFDGADDSVGGTTEASRVVITLTKQREVDNVEFFGSPGQTTLSEKRNP